MQGATSNPYAQRQYGAPSPAAANQYAPQGTRVPGMEPKGEQQVAQNTPSEPLLGFLYSISRTPYGEFWPLYQGENTIGRNPDCDIVLAEESVSGFHGSILIQKQWGSQKTIASIEDKGSKNGIGLNNVGVVGKQFCENGDRIFIGPNYELLLILIDPAAIGLKVCEDFKACQPAQSTQPQASAGNYTQGTNPGVSMPKFPPSFSQPMGNPTPGSWATPAQRPQYNDGTVGTSGEAMPQRGGTITQ